MNFCFVSIKWPLVFKLSKFLIYTNICLYVHKLLNGQPNPGLPSTHHRRVACSFRDQSLFQIFQISLTSLRQLETNGNMMTFVLKLFGFVPYHCFLILYFLWCTVASRLQELALSLSLKCLSFDFVGTSIDESSEEFGTVQVFSSFVLDV